MKTLVLTILISAAMMAWPTSGTAATIVVDTTMDVVANDGYCSLREAIINARNQNQSGSVDCAAGSAGINTIIFHRSLANATVTLNGNFLPGASGQMIIEGPAPGDSGGITLDANLASQVMHSTGQGVDETLTILRDLTITNGRHPTGGGGALSVSSATMQLENVVVSNSATSGDFAGNGGAIFGASARIILIDSQVVDNATEGDNFRGGGIYVQASELTLIRSRVLNNRTFGQHAHGAGIAASTNQGSTLGNQVHIIDSVIAGNSAQGSSSSGGGLYANFSSVVIENSTISGNSTSFQAGGLWVGNGELNLINSTVSANSGAITGGVRVMEGTGTLLHSTVAFNHAPPPYSRDISVQGTTNTAATLNLINALVVQADSGATTCSATLNGSIANHNSLSTHASCTGVATAPEAIHLGPLVQHGGLTRVHPLWPGSVAIDAGGDCETDFGISHDQLGEARPGGTSSACDLGAFEVAGPPITADLQIVKSVNPTAAEVGENVTFTITATNLGPDHDSGVVVADQLPAGFTFVSSTAEVGSYDEVTGLWEISRLVASGSRTLTIEATATGINDYVNTATVWGERFDPDLSNNSDQAVVAVIPHQVDLEIVKTVYPLESAIDEIVTFTLTAGNRGPDPATGVVVVDSLPSGYLFVSASSDTGAYDPSSGQWMVGDLAVGQQEQLLIEAQVRSFTNYLNTATISGDQDDPDLTNNNDSAEPYIPPPPEAITVNTLLDVVADDGLCSLREAIINALNQDQSGSTDCVVARTVRFDKSLIGGTIELNGTQFPTVGEDLFIEGPVPGDPGGLTLDAGGMSRFFDMDDAADFSISNMTLTGGRTTGAGEHGGAMRLTEGTHALLERVRLIGNMTENGSGGAIYAHDSTVSVNDSELVGNQVLAATESGGAIHAHLRSIELFGTTLADNQSTGNGGGIHVNHGELSMVNSTLSGNTSGGSGGGVNLDRSSATLIHTTVAFNNASNGGGGIYVTASSDDPVELSLLNSLAVGNHCHVSGAANYTLVSTGSLSTASGCVEGSATAAEDIKLQELAENGGLTRTHAIVADSVAIEFAGDCQGDFSVFQDQRGEPRPGGNSTACDAGAFEFSYRHIDSIFNDRFAGAGQ
jgi:uncharacterized repeat protein (TIGR01451 family)/CSLREA domain-containing protein